MSGVFSVGGRDSLMVMRKTVMESSAEMPRVTFSPDSLGTYVSTPVVRLEDGEVANHPPRPASLGRLGDIGRVQGHNSSAYVQAVSTKPEIRIQDYSIVCRAR
ncbi:hypothetical protein E2C01_053703 [Portunus trituberculatus]|uniref:Uncharacterized protein n=1 Tax=Portunus trituberculatus TaxID=210409 RepID=A0A5B7GR69_PORTR|nr:hypothetical protein [Portunus trituberculatus]